MINRENKNYMLRLLEKDLRLDGRKPLDFRKDILIEKGISKTAEGSAHVKLGDTEVFAGVKLEINKPFPDTPEEGGIAVNAELLPLSNPEFEAGPPGIDAIELARVVDRGIRESKAIDTKSLLIATAEKAWFVNIDIMTINDAGNLIDAAGIAALAALMDAKFPHYDGIKVDYKVKTEKRLGLLKDPLPITVFKIGNKFIVDPVNEEEQVYDARLTVTTTKDNLICSLQKGGDMTLTLQDIEEMVKIGLQKGKELRKLFK